MRNALKTAVTLAVIAVGVCGARSASAAAAGVVFVHGTGDYSTPTTAQLQTAYSNSGSAVSSYWTQSSIDSMRNGRKYVVVGYQGATKDATTSYADVANQINTWGTYNNITYGSTSNDGILIVTHSNGSNPVRYILAHSSASTATYNTWYWARKVVFIAGDNKGTPLADKVTTSGSLASIANSVVSLFGSSYNNAAVWQQRTDRMATANSNGTYGACPATNGGASVTSINSIPIETVVGTDVYAAIWSGDAYCGGYSMTAGLKATKIYGFGLGACSDGFIGCDSASYVGTNIVWDGRINHNQSRRSCHGLGGTLATDVNNTISYSIPADYTISPSAQACNATTQGWQTASPYAGNFYWYGCTSSMHTDTSTDADCFVAYGGDNGYVAPTDFASTGYANSAYYSSGTACPDSWLGDGECDLCLIAKYGYDAAPGSTNADDCVNYGTGTTNKCADLAYYDQAGAIGYYSYTATH